MAETWTTPIAHAATDVPSAATVNPHMRDNPRYLWFRSAVILDRAAAYSVANAAWTPIPFETSDELADTDTMHDGTNKTRITFARAGRIISGGWIQWAASGVGSRGVRIKHSSGNVYGGLLEDGQDPGFADPCVSLPPIIIPVAANDYIELEGFQDTGGNLNAADANFWAAWMTRSAL